MGDTGWVLASKGKWAHSGWIMGDRSCMMADSISRLVTAQAARDVFSSHKATSCHVPGSPTRDKNGCKLYNS